MKRASLYAAAAFTVALFVLPAAAQYPDCGQVCTPLVSCDTECAADPGKGEGEATTCGEYGVCDGCTVSLPKAALPLGPLSAELPPLDLEPPAATPLSPCTAQCNEGPDVTCYGNPCSAVNQACPSQRGYCYSASEGSKYCDDCSGPCTQGCQSGQPPPTGCTCNECCVKGGYFGGSSGPGGNCLCLE